MSVSGVDSTETPLSLAVTLCNWNFVGLIVEAYLRISLSLKVGPKMLRGAMDKQNRQVLKRPRCMADWQLDYHRIVAIADSGAGPIIADLLLSFISRGCISNTPLDVTPLVQHFWACCNRACAVEVFKGIESVRFRTFFYQYDRFRERAIRGDGRLDFEDAIRGEGRYYPEDAIRGAERYDLEDLLVQIIYAPLTYAGKLSTLGQEMRSSLNTEQFEKRVPFPWSAVDPTALMDKPHLLYAYKDLHPRQWPRRLYFTGRDKPTYVRNAQELLSDYVAAIIPE
jgi:hypothetical protein